MTEEEHRPVHLVCSVGLGRWDANLQRRVYDRAVYRIPSLGDDTESTPFAPVALAKLYSQYRGTSIAKVSVLVTDLAQKDSYSNIEAEFQRVGVMAHPVPMKEGRSPGEIEEIFDALLRTIGANERILLDVTFSLRHLPFVYLAVLTYLTAYRGAQIEGIYYGAYELRDLATNIADILDITGLFRITEWYHAVQTVRDSGDLRGVERMLRQDIVRTPAWGERDDPLHDVLPTVTSLAAQLRTGLPIETGITAATLAAQIDVLEGSTRVDPMTRRALDLLRQEVESLAVSSLVAEKAALVLDRPELERQLRLIEKYLDQHDVDAALMIFREWLVNLVLFARGRGADWLKETPRNSASERLRKVAKRNREGRATPVEQRLAVVWSMTEMRNPVAHAGMQLDAVQVNQEFEQRVRDHLDGARRLLADREMHRYLQGDHL